MKLHLNRSYSLINNVQYVNFPRQKLKQDFDLRTGKTKRLGVEALLNLSYFSNNLIFYIKYFIKYYKLLNEPHLIRNIHRNIFYL